MIFKRKEGNLISHTLSKDYIHPEKMPAHPKEK